MEIIECYELYVDLKVYFGHLDGQYAVIVQDQGKFIQEVNLIQGTDKSDIENFYRNFIDLYS